MQEDIRDPNLPPGEPNPVEPRPLEFNPDLPGGQMQQPDPVESWWNEHIRGSVIGRNTEMWNYLYSTLPALRAKLGMK